MAIKESALAVITSIAQGDFVRVVTSTGASRRMTVNNFGRAITGSITFLRQTIDTQGVTFTLSSNYRGTMFIYDSTAGNNGEYIVYSSGTGAVNTKPISAANGVTIDTSVSYRIKITSSSGTRMVAFITAQGSISV